MKGEPMYFVDPPPTYPGGYTYFWNPFLGPMVAIAGLVVILSVVANVRIHKAPTPYWHRATTQPPLRSPFALGIWMRRMGVLELLWGAIFCVWETIGMCFVLVRKGGGPNPADIGAALFLLFLGLAVCTGALGLSWVIDLRVTRRLSRIAKEEASCQEDGTHDRGSPQRRTR